MARKGTCVECAAVTSGQGRRCRACAWAFRRRARSASLRTGRALAPGWRAERIWRIAEWIDLNPGRSRATIAAVFGLSVRQLNADLCLAREAYGWPIARRDGYRVDPPPGTYSAWRRVVAPEALGAAS